jgi:hypothetical protein
MRGSGLSGKSLRRTRMATSVTISARMEAAAPMDRVTGTAAAGRNSAVGLVL